MEKLDKLVEVTDLREIWKHEAHDFTPWLVENIDVLGSTLGIDISVEETESQVGDFSLDVFAVEGDTGRKIIIENQLEDTNHDHLGKLITYASGKDAELIIWIVKESRQEHRSAIEWLNNHTDDSLGFFLCEIKLYKIGESKPAPKFDIIEQPNNWAKEMKRSTRSRTRTKLPKIKDMLKWGVVKAGDILFVKDTQEEAELLLNGHVRYNDEEMSMQKWLKTVTGWSSVETYAFAYHKDTNESLYVIRKKYMEENDL